MYCIGGSRRGKNGVTGRCRLVEKQGSETLWPSIIDTDRTIKIYFYKRILQLPKAKQVDDQYAFDTSEATSQREDSDDELTDDISLDSLSGDIIIADIKKRKPSIKTAPLTEPLKQSRDSFKDIEENTHDEESEGDPDFDLGSPEIIQDFDDYCISLEYSSVSLVSIAEKSTKDDVSADISRDGFILPDKPEIKLDIPEDIEIVLPAAPYKYNIPESVDPSTPKTPRTPRAHKQFNENMDDFEKAENLEKAPVINLNAVHRGSKKFKKIRVHKLLLSGGSFRRRNNRSVSKKIDGSGILDGIIVETIQKRKEKKDKCINM
jgi:hypothetical protein